jgi:hypothetical protein
LLELWGLTVEEVYRCLIFIKLFRCLFHGLIIDYKSGNSGGYNH